MASVEIQVDRELLKQQKIFVATPMYGGVCAGMYTKSIADLAAICSANGIGLQLYYLFNESLITRARNYCCDEFLRSDATHMMFIDSDIGFNPHDVIALLALMINDPDKYDVIGGPYPKKCISWEKIKLAVDKGFADEDPKVLENFVGDYVFNPKGGTNEIPLNKPVEVAEIGTGFMMLTKQVLIDYAKAYPDLAYKPDHVRTEHFDGSREIHAFFDTVIDENKRYLSEDYMFCRNVEKMGKSIWFCPWMQMHHVGTYIFSGSLQHIAMIGAAATADAAQIKHIKHKKKK